VFTILNKDKHHRSSTYGNAPMPYSERLTWDGVALHAGGLPGYPSSHGCVHLPSEFARLLFGITRKGTTVVIAGESTAPRSVVHPPMLTPVSADSGAPTPDHDQSLMEDYRSVPGASPAGPITLVASGADQRVIVLRNGVEIGRAKIGIEDVGEPLGTHAYTVLGPCADALDAAGHQRGAGKRGRLGEPGRHSQVRSRSKIQLRLRDRDAPHPVLGAGDVRYFLPPGDCCWRTISRQPTGRRMNV
jgi:hypothetical protein